MGQEQLVGFGRLGCPMCVQVFKRQYLLARKRRGLPGGYAGRIPHACMADPKKVEPGLDGEPSVRQGVFLAPEAHGSSQLLADIESAVLVEDFEKAAFLRDCLASSRVKGKQADDS
jgi:protein-arginine kinase activator protein McsA